MLKIHNVRGTRLCAFCKYWYDPTNSAIRPKNTRAGFWEYEHTVTNKCTKYNAPKPSWAQCLDYEPKV